MPTTYRVMMDIPSAKWEVYAGSEVIFLEVSEENALAQRDVLVRNEDPDLLVMCPRCGKSDVLVGYEIETVRNVIARKSLDPDGNILEKRTEECDHEIGRFDVLWEARCRDCNHRASFRDFLIGGKGLGKEGGQ